MPDQAGAWGTAAAAGAVTVAIPLSFPPDGGPTGLDQRIGGPISAALDPRPWVAEVLALASNTWVVIALMLAGAAWFGWQQRWWRAATMVAVPEVAAGLNTWALKPFWGRPLHDYLAYPSGHTVHLVAVATTFLVLIESTRARAVIMRLRGGGVGVGGDRHDRPRLSPRHRHHRRGRCGRRAVGAAVLGDRAAATAYDSGRLIGTRPR